MCEHVYSNNRALCKQAESCDDVGHPYKEELSQSAKTLLVRYSSL